MTNQNYTVRKNRAENCVLIADDDSLIRTMIKKGLSSMSRIEEAEKGNDVLQEILKFDPTAFIIMLSGDAIKDNVVRCLQNGAKGFIGKPFHHDVLMRYVHMCNTIQYNDDLEVADPRV